MAVGCDRTKQEATSRTFLINKSKERNMFVAEHFLSNIVRDNGKYPVSTNGVTRYLMACRFLGLKHHFHYSEKKPDRKEDVIYQG